MLVNNFNCFYNKQVKKDNPHFGALKIDREVVSNVDFFKKNENLKYVTEIAEELKNTKFYDLHVKYTGDRTWHCGIIDKQARQDIHKSIDKDIYAPFRRYETGYLTQNKNFIVLNYVGEHHNSIPSWWSTYFEVGTEEEAEKLIYDFMVKYYDLNRKYSFSLEDDGFKGFILANTKYDKNESINYFKEAAKELDENEAKTAIELADYLEACGKIV